MTNIKFSEWQNMDLRVGEIKEVNDHPNADKLYVLKVDIGEKEIQLVAGIKKFYTKEELTGKKIIVFTNLEPAVLRGAKSEGMLLAADTKDGPILLSPEKNAENGAKIR